MTTRRSDSLQLDQVRPGEAIARDVGLVRQFMSADLLTRGDGWERGVRSVLLQNDVIAIDVIVDRALDIASARIRQLPIAWRSPTGVVAPWYVENSSFGPFRAFFGGLLTTCGLDHIGPPAERPADRYGYASRPTDPFPMHGRISGSPASLSSYGISEMDGRVEAFVEGTVAQVALFSEHLILKRRISIQYGSSRVEVRDFVVNEGYASTPLAVLYHVNVGWPVVAPGAEITPPARITAADKRASSPRVPQRGSSETVRSYAVEAAEGCPAVASIVNRHLDPQTAAGVRIAWDHKAMPSMFQWEIANIGGNYAVGLEPATRLAEPHGAAPFPIIEPGETRQLGLTIELLHGPAGADLLK